MDKYNKLEKKARDFATKAHEGQLRKYTGEPYIVHPASVVAILKTVQCTIEMVQAAWLHDVVEDTEVTIQQVEKQFGKTVALLVSDLTDVSVLTDGNRKVRKAIDREHSSNALSFSKTIKLADLIDNTSSICEHDLKFAKVYLEEKRLLLEVLKDGDDELWKMANEQASNELFR